MFERAAVLNPNMLSICRGFGHMMRYAEVIQKATTPTQGYSRTNFVFVNPAQFYFLVFKRTSF